MDNMASGAETVIAVLDMLKHITDVTPSWLTPRLLPPKLVPIAHKTASSTTWQPSSSPWLILKFVKKTAARHAHR